MSPPQFLVDLLPEALKGVAGLVWFGLLGLIALVVLIVVGVVLRNLFGGKKKFREDNPLEEDLTTFPPPPKAGPRKLLVQGHPARVRLVVLAPVGKAQKLDAGKAEALLEHVVRGLGTVASADKPRVKVWPPQLSHEGFSETFLRVIKGAGKEGRASRWVLMVGRAKVGEQSLLVGLGLLTDEETNLGKLRPKIDQWGELIKVKG